jgi:hypothetical protein
MPLRSSIGSIRKSGMTGEPIASILKSVSIHDFEFNHLMETAIYIGTQA